MAFNSFVDKAKSAFAGAAQQIVPRIEEKVAGSFGKLGNIANLTDEIIDTFGYNNYDQRTAAFIKKIGSEDITSLVVRRAPIASALNSALDAISLGTWNTTRQEHGYDRLYHLSLIVNGRYSIQRLGRVSVTLKDADSPGTEFMDVALSTFGEPLTIKQMLQTTLQRVGPKVFFQYDSFRNNCQNFVANMLRANGLMTPQLQAFILQPVEELLKKQPDYFDAVTKSITNAGQIFGAGKAHVQGSRKRSVDTMEGGKPPGIDYAFSEDDIRALCGDIPILRYPELADMSEPEDLFQGKVGAALLFLTDGPSDGHWIAVLDKPDHYEVFDSFGTAIDGQRKWLDRGSLLEFGQTAPLLSKLLKGEGKEVIHNTKKLQKDDADTCGRYVAARIVRAATSLPDFIEELQADGRSPDVNVTLMTRLPRTAGAMHGGSMRGCKKPAKMVGGYAKQPAAAPPAAAPPEPAFPGLQHMTHILIQDNNGLQQFQVPVDFDATSIAGWYLAVKAALPPQYAQLADQNFYLLSMFENSIVDQDGYTTDIDPAADDAGEGNGDVDDMYVLRAFMGEEGFGGFHGLRDDQMWFTAKFEPSPRILE